ncbi:hypothetical protein HME9302_00860 [Alteripontixanthobacter maritimus]|uniref:Uncharacterized protein n=2 Tax=Alteripontixanthobacter maritimus TaxID=2161824 RepID=A0A369Q9T3_9SPHN|nr:hypothetical protein HME9302_00860 [Alteripontixanthobacter maritimus]
MVAFGDTDRERKEEECRDARKRIARGDKTALPKGCRPLKPVTIYIPTVQIGIDRAAK